MDLCLCGFTCMTVLFSCLFGTFMCNNEAQRKKEVRTEEWLTRLKRRLTWTDIEACRKAR